MSQGPLMPKATAVWLVENTSLVVRADRRFLQAAPARGEGHRRRRGRGRHQGPRPDHDRPAHPRGDRDGRRRTRITASAWPSPRSSCRSIKRTKKGPRYTPVSRRHDRPNAILWLLRNHPELKDAQIMRLVGTTKTTIQQIRDRTHWNSGSLQPMDPVTLGLSSQIDLDFEVQRAAKDRPHVEPAGRRRHPDARRGDDRARARAREPFADMSRPKPDRKRRSTSIRSSPS